MSSKLTVKNVAVAGKRLTVDFSCEGQLRKYFLADKFYAEYNTSIEDVPEAMLVIPFLATVCPVAWVNQAEIHVETVDKNFLKCLPVVGNSLQKFYPKLKLGGNIQVSRVFEPKIQSRSKNMLLFSGGVDALASYIKHRDENLTLVAILGGDLDPENIEAWNTVIKPIRDFSLRTKTPLRTVRSNFKYMLDHFMLSQYNDRIEGLWWGRVMHGLAMIGLCAPLAYADGIERLYIAASDTSENPEGWGSHPDIDNNIGWTGTKVFHDGYEMRRQEKMELCADYIKNVNSQVTIRSCWESKKGDNCSHCEKCSRTIVGLELTGLDPNEYGFKVAADSFLSIEKNLLDHAWEFGDAERFFWEDLKNHVFLAENTFHPQAGSMIKWLSQFEIKSLYCEKTSKLEPVRRILLFLFKVFPYRMKQLTRKIGSRFLPAMK